MFRAKQKACRRGRFTNLSHALIAQRGRNSSCEYRSLGCPQLTSSSFDVSVHFRVARQRYFKCECKCYALSCLFKSAFHFLIGFLPSKLCFSLKSVPLYTKAYQLRIGSVPADRCYWLIKSKTGFSSVHPSAVEPESELRPKWCKMHFTYVFKLLFQR